METRELAFEPHRVPLLAQYALRRESVVLGETTSMAAA
jgi:hypothetical protein